MKKTILLVVTLFFSLVFCFGNPTIYDADSYEYRMAEHLCNLAGVTGPSTALPITGDEILLALNRIPDFKLSSDAQALKDYLQHSLETKPNLEFKVHTEITPAFYLNTQFNKAPSEGGGSDYFYIPYIEQKPFLKIGAEFGFANFGFLEVDFDMKNKPLQMVYPFSSMDWIVGYLGFKNAPENFVAGALNEIPLLARGALGNKAFNVIIGRTPHSIGNGFTGNMAVGNNFDYQEILKISFFNNIFTYNNSITHFDTQNSLLDFDRAAFGGMHQTRVVNRLDFNLFDQFRFAVNFISMYFTSSAFDARWLTPMMFSHNYYNFSENKILMPGDEANNLNVFELTWNFLPKWKIGFQFALDQVQAKFFGENPDALPPAFGGLLNLSWQEQFKANILSVWLEGAYTNPYLYLNEKYNPKQEGNEIVRGEQNFNYDYIVGYFRPKGHTSSASYSGYKYGPDTIAIAAGVDGFNLAHGIEYNASILYKVHGEKGVLSPDFKYTGATTPTGNYPEHNLLLQANAKWIILHDTLDIFGGIAFSYYHNFQNRPGQMFLPQAHFGVSWRPFN